VPKEQEELLTLQILEYIAGEPQTLKSLVDLTKSNSATVSWICQNLRGKGIITQNNEGFFCPSNPDNSVPSKHNFSMDIAINQSLDHPL